MSSTNRGYDRHTADYYVTPPYPIKQFLNELLLAEKIDRPDRLIWMDPCAGGSDKDVMAYPSVIKEEFNPTVITMDIREDSLAEIKGDYRFFDIHTLFQNQGPDIIITNPPFFIAMDIIQKALNDVCDNGYVVMLLRLNFFGGKNKFGFFQANMPKYCFVHHKRINFIPKWLQAKLKEETGKAPSGDSIEYAHFVWQKGYHPDFTMLKVI